MTLTLTLHWFPLGTIYPYSSPVATSYQLAISKCQALPSYSQWEARLKSKSSIQIFLLASNTQCFTHKHVATQFFLTLLGTQSIKQNRNNSQVKKSQLMVVLSGDTCPCVCTYPGRFRLINSIDSEYEPLIVGTSVITIQSLVWSSIWI